MRLLAMLLWVPAMAWSMSVEDARHLLNRTGFGATPEEIRGIAALDRTAAIEQILAGVQAEPTTKAPYWADEPVGGLFTLRLMALRGQRGEDVKLEREAIKRKQEAQERARAAELKAWWWNELIRTKSPLTERMVLFWHNHFTSEIDTVKSPELMYQQNALFRQHALGQFDELLLAATIDAAMIIYLDNNSNTKGNPNENYAREVMELFTLGEGQGYTEDDIKEAARAFTGWRVNDVSKRFVFEEKLHDKTEKTILGRTGTFTGEDVVRILLEEERTAVFITGKMWQAFVCDGVDAGEVERIATRFRDAGYDMKVLLRELLQADAFWAAENRGNMIKSPVDLVAGSCRMFDTHPAQSYEISAFGKLLGQDLFAPPDVSGWKGGRYWIDANTLLVRHQLSRLVLSVPDEEKIKRFESSLKQKQLAALQAERERKEIERLLDDQKSLLDQVLEDEGFGVFGGDEDEELAGMLPDVAKLDAAVDRVLNDELSPEEMVRREFANAKAFDLRKWVEEQGLDRASLEQVLLPTTPVRQMDEMMAATEVVPQLLMDPTFQLK